MNLWGVGEAERVDWLGSLTCEVVAALWGGAGIGEGRGDLLRVGYPC